MCGIFIQATSCQLHGLFIQAMSCYNRLQTGYVFSMCLTPRRYLQGPKPSNIGLAHIGTIRIHNSTPFSFWPELVQFWTNSAFDRFVFALPDLGSGFETRQIHHVTKLTKRDAIMTFSRLYWSGFELFRFWWKSNVVCISIFRSGSSSGLFCMILGHMFLLQESIRSH